MAATTTTTFVSGFTGYIALHLTKQLLEKGYKVIGSARSTTKAEKFAKLFNHPNFSYVIVSDICSLKEFEEVFKSHPEIESVFHTASPLIFASDDAKTQILDPAVNGTVNILKAIKGYGTNVKRVVITTSYAAHNGYYQHYFEPNTVVNEESKSTMTLDMAINENDEKPYWASKALAERAAWKFMEDESPKFTITTLAPTYTFGPQAFDELKSEVPSTLVYIQMVLNAKDGNLPPVAACAVDVRDIAKGHILALEKPETIGKRLLMTSSKFSLEFFANIINKHFPELGLPQQQHVDPKDINCPTVDSTKTLALLGMETIPIETTIVDTVKQMTS